MRTFPDGRGGRIFQVEGKSRHNGRETGMSAFGSYECFSLAGGPSTIVEVKAKESGKTSRERIKDNPELRNLALLGLYLLVMESQQRILNGKLLGSNLHFRNNVLLLRKTVVGSGDGRKNGDC